MFNYLKNIDLSQEAFDELKTCIKNAAQNVEKTGDKYKSIFTAKGKYEMLLPLAKANLVDLAATDTVIISPD